LALAPLACGADTISLLPAMGGSAGEAAGTAGTHNDTGGDAGNESHGGADGGAGRSGSASGGSLSNGGSSCSGSGCAGFGNGGAPTFGGNAQCVSPFDNCTPCGPNQQCPNGMHCSVELQNKCVWCLRDEDCGSRDAHCDVTTGRCGPPCDAEQRCTDARVCDVAQDVCVQCVGRQDCERNRPDLPYCHQRRCVECEVSDDCSGPGRQYCIGYRCIECFTDHDCPNGEFCNIDGHCL
jgi:hypothetical protein